MLVSLDLTSQTGPLAHLGPDVAVGGRQDTDLLLSGNVADLGDNLVQQALDFVNAKPADADLKVAVLAEDNDVVILTVGRRILLGQVGRDDRNARGVEAGRQRDECQFERKAAEKRWAAHRFLSDDMASGVVRARSGSSCCLRSQRGYHGSAVGPKERPTARGDARLDEVAEDVGRPDELCCAARLRLALAAGTPVRVEVVDVGHDRVAANEGEVWHQSEVRARGAGEKMARTGTTYRRPRPTTLPASCRGPRPWRDARAGSGVSGRARSRQTCRPPASSWRARRPSDAARASRGRAVACARAAGQGGSAGRAQSGASPAPTGPTEARAPAASTSSCGPKASLLPRRRRRPLAAGKGGQRREMSDERRVGGSGPAHLGVGWAEGWERAFRDHADAEQAAREHRAERE